MANDTTAIDWSEMIVIFNALVRSIEQLHAAINAENVDDDELYELEEELNDYQILLARLRQRYADIPDKGELSEALKRKLSALG